MPRPKNPNRDPEADLKVFLGEELARARIAAGFATQEALANHLGFDRSVITKTESGDRAPTNEVLAAWCAAGDLDYEHYAKLAKVARSADGPAPPWFVDYLELEALATALRAWSPLLFPGLLQPADYARELFLAAGADAERAEELLSVRLRRQAVFDRPGGAPHMVFVIDEPVLHRLIHSPQVMYETIMHVVGISERPNVIVQVVPSAKGANAGLSGAFGIATSPDGVDTLRMDTVEDWITNDRPLVHRATVIFDLVRARALACDESRTVMAEAAEQWKPR
jgi:transcriptional regulator with XRE-family HTH domain